MGGRAGAVRGVGRVDVEEGSMGGGAGHLEQGA